VKQSSIGCGITENPDKVEKTAVRVWGDPDEEAGL
jgi:hypothetical protein